MKKLLALILCINILISCAGIANASTISTKDAPGEKTYIVILDAPPVYSKERVSFYSIDDSTYRQALLEEQENIKSKIPAFSKFSLRKNEQEAKNYTYTEVLNGFTVECDAETAEYIKTIDGVKVVFQDTSMEFVMPEELGASELLTQTQTEESAILSQANAGNMINVKSAYDKGYDGTGQAIAIIDSGTHVKNSYYSLNNTQNLKLTKEKVAEIIKNNTLNVPATVDSAYVSDKIPYAYNYYTKDSALSTANLHGAHVAGIAAGGTVSVSDGVISGIAPEAQILFFGVFNESGGADFTDMAASIEDAVKFGVDAINLSIGTKCFSENVALSAYQTAVENAKNAGCTVIFAAGNSDRQHYGVSNIDYSTSDNTNYKNSTKVASVQNGYAYMNYIKDQSGTKYPCSVKGSAAAFSSLPIVDCGTGNAAELAQIDLSGKEVALITLPDRLIAGSVENTLTLVKKCGDLAHNAGADAVVVINNSVDIKDGSSGVTYPLFLVSKESGKELIKQTSLDFTNETIVIQRSSTPTANAFSSYGYSDNLDITVDFAAVGGNVYSSYGNGTFKNLTGTSMAAPQAAGATVLMDKYVEDNFPSYQDEEKVMLIKNLLASTAKTIYADGGALQSPRKVGSGLIQLDKAMSEKVILTAKDSQESRINLGADLKNSFNVEFTVHNLGDSDIAFDEVLVELSTDDYKSYGSKGYGICGVKKLTKTVSGASEIFVPAKGREDVSLTVTLDDDEVNEIKTVMKNGFFIDGKVTLSNQENTVLGIPFSGFWGSWDKLPIISPDKLGIYSERADGLYADMMIGTKDSKLFMPMSENPDGTVVDSKVVYHAVPQRNAYLTVKFDDRVVMSEGAFYNKGYQFAYYDEATIKDLASVSTITLEFYLPYYAGTDKKQTITIDVEKDNEAPKILQIASKTTDGTTSLSFVVSDNYGVSAIESRAVSTEDATPKRSIVNINKTSQACSFNITGLDEIFYFVYDSAHNMTAILPEVGISVLNDVATYKNNTTKPVSGTCMIAVYENKKMQSFVPLGELTLLPYENKTFDLSEYKDKEYKLFFWKDVNTTLEPICKNYYTY